MVDERRGQPPTHDRGGEAREEEPLRRVAFDPAVREDEEDDLADDAERPERADRAGAIPVVEEKRGEEGVEGPVARLHREAREEERDQPGRNGRAPLPGVRLLPGVRGNRRRGSRRRAPGGRVGRQGERGGHDQGEPREHEEGHGGDREPFEQCTDPEDGRDVADRAPEPDVDVPGGALTEAAQGQRLELGQHPLPEEAEHEERREEGRESGRPRDGRERGERPGRRDAHHLPARPGPVGGVPPHPRGEELGGRQGREERPDGPRVEPPVEQVRREVRQEHPGRREVREVPGPEPPLAAPRAAPSPSRNHRRLPRAAASSFTSRIGSSPIVQEPIAETIARAAHTRLEIGGGANSR